MTSRRRKFRTASRVAAAMTTLFVIAALAAGDGSRGLFSSVRAQSATATLSGTVRDERDAFLPAVNITILNLNTAFERHATTNDAGYYVIPLLPPGHYSMTAERAGFATVEIRDVTLNVNDNRSLRLKLKVAEVGESVTIIETVETVEETASVGTLVGRQFVANLPLNGRSFQSLFEFTPGTVLTKATFNEQGQFSVNGQRANANYFMVDGVGANVGANVNAAPGQAAAGSLPALTVLGGTNNLVSVDALEEFRIQTSGYAPEFGRTSGAQVSIITRSGTNEFRGSLFNYFRNDALDANDFFANSRGLKKSALRQNDFGGVIGGAMVRDRAFFFASYEGLRLRQPQVAITDVPSLAARQNAPAALRPFLAAFPLPTGATFGNGFAEFAAAYSDPSSLDAASLRLDAVLTPRATLFGRYNHAPSRTLQRRGVTTPGFGGQSVNTVNSTSLKTQTLTVGATASLSSKTTNDLRFNWSASSGATSLLMDDFGGAVVVPASLLFPPFASPATSGFRMLLRGGMNANFGVGRIVDNRQRQLNVVENLSVVRGSHQLKFGADFRRLTPTYNPLRYMQSVVFGDGTTTGAAATATGKAYQVQISAEAETRAPVFTNFSAYAQDTWRASPRLTFTYGVRWELNPPPTERRGNAPFTVTGLDLRDGSVVFEQAGSTPLALAPRGTPLWRTTYANFAPRFGAAYQLSRTSGTVLRGGLGIFYDLGDGQAGQAFGGVFPYHREKLLSNVAFPVSPALAEPPPLTLDPPYGALFAFDPRLKLPYALQWNLSVEQPLGASESLTVSYVASAGRRLLRETALVNPSSAFTVVRAVSNTSASDYHSLQAQFQRRLARGVQAMIFYTWAHAIDDDSDDSSNVFFQKGASFDHERGASNFDVRHSLTALASYTLPRPVAGGSSFARALTRDWTVDAIFRARTATPVNVFRSTGVVIGDLIEVQRPSLVAGVPPYLDDRTVAGGRRINPAAFAFTPGGQGTLGRNALRGFGFSQLDAALRRQFSLTERLNLQLRAEVFNVLNHPNFGDPAGDLSDRLFGQATQMLGRSLGTGGVNGGLSPLYQIGGARSVQLAVKLQF